MKILFICKGNVGRSQMAEALLRRTKPEFDVLSAGIQKDTPTKYVHPTREVIDVMAEIGIDVSTQKVKTINQDFTNGADNIIYMCKKSDLPNYLQNSAKLTYWKIDDPYQTGIDTFRKIRDEIKHLVETTFK